ncbi:hypothetical protein [Streptomyces melanogenes]|uniref:hypothetical protein n=1 Tax=Streptomyces melanogenes TaxID=67326 RepID=UPI00167CCBC8|nr:hypothetical protein [Streptomyces melanogenes]GGP95184.1 hypothetical protein GCM10010278_86250 [Streptomyces melanogenes]
MAGPQLADCLWGDAPAPAPEPSRGPRKSVGADVEASVKYGRTQLSTAWAADGRRPMRSLLVAAGGAVAFSRAGAGTGGHPV